ncbi:hypothetical protein DFA_02048 [Cavenderia fasciculata]|uniref:Uncharacterized protein n=1 Tax=Cavenderia fasciculata TaxID=261658 RepID=F4PYJ6_CACFS|nr:uncharacterized protein DFA_02048 [Cavenderia fasciculata]EGG19262.1 hypothetical protein DFA_02048 [Cavenderia fasciculata]|eukprot:XP_004357533.1 hypothetical protein DFA_02048 [Cavenderia fasciculata]
MLVANISQQHLEKHCLLYDQDQFQEFIYYISKKSFNEDEIILTGKENSSSNNSIDDWRRTGGDSIQLSSNQNNNNNQNNNQNNNIFSSQLILETIDRIEFIFDQYYEYKDEKQKEIFKKLKSYCEDQFDYLDATQKKIILFSEILQFIGGNGVNLAKHMLQWSFNQQESTTKMLQHVINKFGYACVFKNGSESQVQETIDQIDKSYLENNQYRWWVDCYCIATGHLSVLQFLQKQNTLFKSQHQFQTLYDTSMQECLNYSLENQRLDAISFLLANKLKPTSPQLQKALEKNNIKLVKLLYENNKKAITGGKFLLSVWDKESIAFYDKILASSNSTTNSKRGDKRLYLTPSLLKQDNLEMFIHLLEALGSGESDARIKEVFDAVQSATPTRIEKYCRDYYLKNQLHLQRPINIGNLLVNGHFDFIKQLQDLNLPLTFTFTSLIGKIGDVGWIPILTKYSAISDWPRDVLASAIQSGRLEMAKYVVKYLSEQGKKVQLTLSHSSYPSLGHNGTIDFSIPYYLVHFEDYQMAEWLLWNVPLLPSDDTPEQLSKFQDAFQNEQNQEIYINYYFLSNDTKLLINNYLQQKLSNQFKLNI